MMPRIIGMLIVALASFIEAVGHLAFKRAAGNAGSSGAMAGIHVLTRTPGWIGLGMACFLIEALLYSVGLRLLDLSLAFPVGSLTFVGVVILSRFWLRESVGTKRWAGVGLIVAGTVLLGVS